MELFFNESRGLSSLVVLRLLRLLRVFRFLKLSRYARDFPVIMISIRKSIRGFAVSLSLLVIFIIVWSGILYYTEQSGCYMDSDFLWHYYFDDSISPFQSIPHSMWFVVVTMTTEGYGDVLPHTLAGKIIATFAMLFGIVLIGLPVTVITSNFALEYNKHQTAQGLKEKYKKFKKENNRVPYIGKEYRLKQMKTNLVLCSKLSTIFDTRLEHLDKSVRRWN